MNIVIVGGGPVGSTLAQQLEKEHKHNITIVERDATRCQELSSRHDILTINGSGTDPDILIKAGLSEADMIIAVTPYDEVNILACHLASKFGVEKRVARIKSSVFDNPLFSLDELGVTDIIEPEGESVVHILEYLYVPETTHIVNFKTADVCLRGYTVTTECRLIDRPAGDLAEITGNNRMQHLVIVRNGHAMVPTGITVIKENDEVLSLMPRDALPDYHKMFDRADNPLRKVVISGSSPLALHLALEVEKVAQRTVLLSEDEAFCQAASIHLHNTEIYHGDPASEEVRNDAGTSTASFFIPVDDDTEENIITGLLAKTEGATRVVAVANNDKHIALFKTLGIDHILHPISLVVKRLFSDIAGFSQGTLFTNSRIDLEMGHFFITKQSGLGGITIIELRQKTKSNFLIGCILRGDKFIVARGNTVVEEDDELIIFYDPKEMKTVTKLFKV